MIITFKQPLYRALTSFDSRRYFDSAQRLKQNHFSLPLRCRTVALVQVWCGSGRTHGAAQRTRRTDRAARSTSGRPEAGEGVGGGIYHVLFVVHGEFVVELGVCTTFQGG